MKAASPALIALLETGEFVRTDLWTITLNGGDVIRWTSADRPIIANGQTFALGPIADRGQVSEKTGVEVATLLLEIDAYADDTINGVPVIQFIARKGFDGANVKLEYAYMADWGLPVVGTVVRFSGRVTSIGNIQGTHAEVTISSWMVLFNVNMPPNLYQAGCLHTVYDAGCGLSQSSYAATTSVSSVASTRYFNTPLTGAPGLYDQGRIQFLTGPNTGLSRSVKANDTTGNFELIEALPALPNVGDTFTVYAGCDNTLATCKARFNNAKRFKGMPFVPVPEAALGG